MNALTDSYPKLGALSLRQCLVLAAVASLLLRAWIAYAFPITGDEAFFYWWGVYLDWGYYDHPPMVGWMIGLMRALFGDTQFAVRLPAVVLPLLVGGLVYWAFAPLSRERASWAVLLYWLTPLSWLNALVTTDTPLVFWSTLSVALLVRAQRPGVPARKRMPWLAGAGLSLGLAFLSKYFAVVLGLTYLVYFAVARRTQWKELLWLVVWALPGALINLGFNYSHGWPNIMFNLFNRNEGAEFAVKKPVGFVLLILYMATPFVLWHLARARATLRSQWQAVLGSGHVLVYLVVVPLVFFALLSAKKTIGLHWILSFYPYVFVLAAMALPMARLRSLGLGLAGFLALHLVAVLVLSMTRLDDWRSNHFYQEIVQGFRTEAVVSASGPSGPVIMADAYNAAALYGFATRTYVPVFGLGRFHARQDDLLVDFSRYQGKTIRVLLMKPPAMEDYAPYFRSVRQWAYQQDGAEFYAVEGEGFDYAAYQQGVQQKILHDFYRIPGWLPMSGCPFCERLCGTTRCGVSR